MKQILPKIAALICIFAINTTACDLLELDELNNDHNALYDVGTDQDASNSDASTNNPIDQDTSDQDTSDQDTSTEYDYEREASITNFGWTKVEALSQHFCHLAIACPEQDPELVRELSRFVTVENCIESGPWSLTIGDLTDTHTAINAGRLQFNPEKVDECLQAIEFASTTCDFDTFYNDEIHIGNPCDEVFTPQQQDGDPCFQNAECFSGQCQRDPNDLETCELATCAETPQRSDIVGLNDDCTVDICDTDLYCNAYTDGPHPVCEPITIKERYESCDLSDGQYCEEGSVCTSYVCQPPPVFVSDGEECSDTHVHCQIGLTCRILADLQPPTCTPVGTQGDACDAQQACQVGFWCDYSLGECVVQSDIDQPCTSNDACPFGTFCDDDYEEPVCDYFPIDYDEEFCSL